MLAFTRKAKESFSVDGPATIIVTRVRGGKVSIAVKAPRQTKVLRSELDPRRKVA